ncbi:MAG: amidohydrolase family protein [Bacteroidales bacterium]|nr:MAG: amidohydrolase family protein [Bacteroidales bacterium]
MVKLLRNSIIYVILLILGSCMKNLPEFDSFPKIDAHVHVRTTDPSFLEQAGSDNFQVLSITTRSASDSAIQGQLDFGAFQKEAFPETISYTTTFSMEGFGNPWWQDSVIIKLKRDFAKGAIAVKVWKDIGMSFRDRDSSFIMIDDPRFDPILDYIASEGKSLVAHIGEPRNCWLHLDSMTVRSDREYFRNHPEYHMYLHADYPSYEDQIQSRDNMLRKHPDLIVIGAHLGSLEWDVDELARCLDTYSNFAVDMAARICHFQVQDREKVRRFIYQYQDRLIYGTDLGVQENSDMEEMKTRIHNAWLEDWRYFTTDEEMTSDIVDGSFHGLKLDSKVLEKIYYQNAKSWYAGLGL